MRLRLKQPGPLWPFPIILSAGHAKKRLLESTGLSKMPVQVSGKDSASSRLQVANSIRCINVASGITVRYYLVWLCLVSVLPYSRTEDGDRWRAVMGLNLYMDATFLLENVILLT